MSQALDWRIAARQSNPDKKLNYIDEPKKPKSSRLQTP